jgi:hypothetical protein
MADDDGRRGGVELTQNSSSNQSMSSIFAAVYGILYLAEENKY